MKIQTFSIVAGSEACNANCPFCVSKMTVPNGVPQGKAPEVNWRNFAKACRLATLGGATTAMITSKGEPTLFPDQVTAYLQAMEKYDFPIIEIQSNGIPVWNKLASDSHNVRQQAASDLQLWHDYGLTTFAISVVGTDPELNRQVYVPHLEKYIDLGGLVDLLHRYKYSVRLACVMIKDGIDNPLKVADLASWAKQRGVEQLTIRPVNKPDDGQSLDGATSRWAAENGLTYDAKLSIKDYLEQRATRLMTLQHGATVYDLNGQNVCLTDSLTRAPEADDLRQLIFFPDGHLRYDWQYEGAILV